MAHFLKLISKGIKYWYLPLIAGIVFILIAIWTLVAPGATYLALTFLFSFGFIFSGATEIAFSISNRDEMENWGWVLALGIVTLILGFVLFLNPGLSAISLALYIGFLAMLRSFAAISNAVDMRSYGIKNWGWLMFFGIIGVLFSLVLIWNPLLAGLTALIWTGLTFMTIGIFSIFFSLQLRKLHKHAEKVPEEVREQFEQLKRDIQERLED